MIVILAITFLSGGNFFVLLLLWPTEIYNVYGKSITPPTTILKVTFFQARTQQASASAAYPSASASSSAPSYASSSSP